MRPICEDCGLGCYSILVAQGMYGTWSPLWYLEENQSWSIIVVILSSGHMVVFGSVSTAGESERFWLVSEWKG
jgi:hypothetical protein